MALFVASLANVSWQGINPPGSGGDPLVYPATTLAGLVAWPPSPVGLPGARVSPSCRILTGQIKMPLKVGAIVLVFILS